MGKAWILLLVACSTLAGAATPESETRGDLRCIIALSALAQASDPAMQQAGMLGMLYFIGRAEGRGGETGLEKALEAEARNVGGADYAPLLQSCGAKMQERGKQITAIGARLSKRGL